MITIILIILCVFMTFILGVVIGTKLKTQNKTQKEISSNFVKKPWGGYTVLTTGKIFKTKILAVNKKQRLSLQYHHQREEYWIVLQGTATIRLGEKMYTLQPTEAFYVAKRALHRIENRHDETLIILEIQVGNYLEEDDIIRVQDDYERNSKTDGAISSADDKNCKKNPESYVKETS